MAKQIAVLVEIDVCSLARGLYKIGSACVDSGAVDARANVRGAGRRDGEGLVAGPPQPGHAQAQAHRAHHAEGVPRNGIQVRTPTHRAGCSMHKC